MAMYAFGVASLPWLKDLEVTKNRDNNSSNNYLAAHRHTHAHGWIAPIVKSVKPSKPCNEAPLLMSYSCSGFIAMYYDDSCCSAAMQGR